MLRKIIATDHSKTTILIRIMVGAIFLSEGIQKFIYPAMRGVGRFEKMGFPNPGLFVSFVGTFEILCGILLLIGLITRGAALAMLINMTVAIVITKIPIALGESFGPFALRELKSYGFWSMAHEMRTDLAMWLGSLFLLIKGGGKWSADKVLMT
ncbi:DoxX family protein [Sinomicrobium weinanense]|uniref:DoxX family protein n=1 Tax=Sinomicrobium weinanense TaxID=2842200 RepID=A0A926JV61_9FLAO|nr:DoxX family protein [Sinomicrobium weinanense]MBC9797793.1 DoxX family protein [Sinomicrobium weinanense]MBU3124877.1 DoxX family protein [Sinomicrobium weinanense]